MSDVTADARCGHTQVIPVENHATGPAQKKLAQLARSKKQLATSGRPRK
jgi:hypothetical protein